MPTSSATSALSKRQPNSARRTLVLSLLPAACLGIYWVMGETGLIIAAFGLPLLWMVYGGLDAQDHATSAPLVPIKESATDHLEHQINDMLFAAKPSEYIAIYNLEIDGASDVARRLGSAGLQTIQQNLQMRYANCLRSHDVVFQSGPLNWTIVAKPGVNLDLEAAIQQASRIQEIADEPLFVNEDRLYLTSCIGFTTAQKPCKGAHVLLQQVRAALGDAVLNGPDSIRAYSPKPRDLSAPNIPATLQDLNGDIETSLEAWFQPQISTDTGLISGFEALARWKDRAAQWHSPATVLPILERNGQMERLTDIILAQSLQALAKWDESGLNIASIGVNFSESDLANPRLYEKVAWDLDRYGIDPNRLNVEVLESVIAGEADDMIVRNVSRLANLGCAIDLDDFGTGHSSISTLRRLPVHRLKIDRSFVTNADLDTEQQKMVATILMMADRLELSCLAEGVETLGEQSILAQLGCRYVQGFGVAKPMPFEQTEEWIRSYQAKQLIPPEIGRKTS